MNLTMNDPKIEISVILYSFEGREIDFKDFKSGIAYLYSNEFTPDFIWGASGGFELTIEGYKTIFRGHDFYVSLDAVKFLIRSLFWLKGDTSRFDKDDIYTESLVSRFQNKNYIKLSKVNDDTISFSYQSATPTITSNRGQRFFKDVTINRNEWIEAVFIGLNEYFEIFDQILAENPENSVTKTLENYLKKDWEDAKNIYNI